MNGLPREAIPRFVSRREILDSLERALALCEFVYHGIRDETCRLIGQRSKPRVLQQ